MGFGNAGTSNWRIWRLWSCQDVVAPQKHPSAQQNSGFVGRLNPPKIKLRGPASPLRLLGPLPCDCLLPLRLHVQIWIELLLIRLTRALRRCKALTCPYHQFYTMRCAVVQCDSSALVVVMISTTLSRASARNPSSVSSHSSPRSPTPPKASFLTNKLYVVACTRSFDGVLCVELTSKTAYRSSRPIVVQLY
jgi:hypothetical protein